MTHLIHPDAQVKNSGSTFDSSILSPHIGSTKPCQFCLLMCPSPSPSLFTANAGPDTHHFLPLCTAVSQWVSLLLHLICPSLSLTCSDLFKNVNQIPLLPCLTPLWLSIKSSTLSANPNPTGPIFLPNLSFHGPTTSLCFSHQAQLLCNCCPLCLLHSSLDSHLFKDGLPWPPQSKVPDRYSPPTPHLSHFL